MNATPTRVKLNRLPADVQWPSWVSDRISYDGSRQELVFTGFMTRCDYDMLRSVSRDGIYQRAIDELYIRSSSHGNPTTRISRELTWLKPFTLLSTLVWVRRSEKHRSATSRRDLSASAVSEHLS